MLFDSHRLIQQRIFALEYVSHEGSPDEICENMFCVNILVFRSTRRTEL